MFNNFAERCEHALGDACGCGWDPIRPNLGSSVEGQDIRAQHRNTRGRHMKSAAKGVSKGSTWIVELEYIARQGL